LFKNIFPFNKRCDYEVSNRRYLLRLKRYVLLRREIVRYLFLLLKGSVDCEMPFVKKKIIGLLI
jgi:hypothetical protein